MYCSDFERTVAERFKKPASDVFDFFFLSLLGKHLCPKDSEDIAFLTVDTLLRYAQRPPLDPAQYNIDKWHQIGTRLIPAAKSVSDLANLSQDTRALLTFALDVIPGGNNQGERYRAKLMLETVVHPPVSTITVRYLAHLTIRKWAGKIADDWPQRLAQMAKEFENSEFFVDLNRLQPFFDESYRGLLHVHNR